MNPSEHIVFKTRAWNILARSFALKRTAGTYLLYGPEGTGRWLLAVSFAALLNCQSPRREEGERSLLLPCGECVNCRKTFALNFEGLHLAVPIPPHGSKLDEAIDRTNEFLEKKRQQPYWIPTSSASTNIPVAVAREIKRNLSMKANPGIIRTVIFYQMERMRTSSTDALLKMIEEPPSDTVIILITSRPDALLPTIQSRAQKIKVSASSTDVIEDHLRRTYEISDKRARLVSRLAEGSVGRAIEIAESYEEEEGSRRGVALLLFKSLFLDKSYDVLAHMNDVLDLKDRGEAEDVLRLWQLLIRDCANVAVCGEDENIVNVDFATDIRKLSQYFSSPRLPVDMAGHIKNTLADLRLNVHIQGAVMALALRLKSDIQAANQL